MINIVLTEYAENIDHFLACFFHNPEGLVEINSIGMQGFSERNKLLISLLTIEKETTHNSTSAMNNRVNGLSGYSHPPVYVNLNILIAAVFNEKRYRESLSVISQTIFFLQANSTFTTTNGNTYTIEMINPSLQDQNNIWASFGGHYYPCVVCKIRRLIFDANEIKRTEIDIREASTNLRKV